MQLFLKKGVKIGPDNVISDNCKNGEDTIITGNVINK
jgi:UDP-3-O-[3-hydroxymyristoyl] glucosamine N-acyltransferase